MPFIPCSFPHSFLLTDEDDPLVPTSPQSPTPHPPPHPCLSPSHVPLTKLPLPRSLALSGKACLPPVVVRKVFVMFMLKKYAQ